jgi:hypothetical protein
MDAVGYGLDDVSVGLCALVEAMRDVADMAVLAATIENLLGPLAAPAFQQAVTTRYRQLTAVGEPDGPCRRDQQG